eukprot:g4142.t1
MSDMTKNVQVELNRLNEQLKKIPMIKQAGEQAGVDPVYLVGGGALFTLFVTYFMFGAGLLCNILGFVYPTYASIKALESPQTDDDKQWLTYWVLYAFFSLIEHFTDTLLYWIPFYFSIKLALLIWMMVPGQKGAIFIYQAIRSRVVVSVPAAAGQRSSSEADSAYAAAPATDAN